MKKMTDKQKRIMAYIIAIWFAIFGTIGMVQTGLNIANCAGRKKETRKAYAAEPSNIESATFRFNLGNIYTTTTTTSTDPVTENNNEIKETWIINEKPQLTPLQFTENSKKLDTDIISYGTRYSNIGFDTIVSNGTRKLDGIIYGKYTSSAKRVYTGTAWINENYRTIKFFQKPEGELLQWLQQNAIKEGGSTPPPQEVIKAIEQSTQQIEFIFTAKSITIQIYNANRETTYIGNWQGTTENGWNSTIGSYNTKPINGTTILQREGFSLHLSPQNISNLSGQIQPTYIPTKGEMTVYENQIKYKFGLASTTEESEYIQIQVNKGEESIKFIPENTVYQNSLNTTGYTQGYQDGFKQGQQEKEMYGITQYNKGKQDGIASANKYTFKGLISAVFDVPIQTLYGMLDFNILGINILSLVMSIVSVILLIAIVKVLL